MKTLQRSHFEFLAVTIAAVVTTLVSWYTNLDQWVAAQFFHPELIRDVWPKQHWWLWKALYDYAFPFTIAAGILALLVYLASHIHDDARIFRRQALYILMVIVIGPGVVINLVVKDHWGRPRPLHTQAFGGEYAYVPPLKIGHTPDKSFVCGHCSVGYAFFALYFLAQNHKALYLSLTLGLAWTLGFTRMTAGGHYLSDVLWSGYLVFLVAYGLYYGWYRRFTPVKASKALLAAN